MSLLADQIRDYCPEKGELAFWWLGQSGFVVKSQSLTLVFDPYLSTTLEDLTRNDERIRHVRMMPIPTPPESLDFCDYVFCSHDHGDHYDRATVEGIMQKKARVIVPPAAKSSLLRDGLPADRILTVGAQDILHLDGLTISAVRAKHNQFDWTEAYGYPYVGFLVEIEGMTLYHAGDTIWFPELAQLLDSFHVDIAMVPINGGDENRTSRGFQSNLMHDEAARLCREIHAGYMIPCHFDMFTINTVEVGRFVNYVNRESDMPPYWVPVVGERLSLRRENLKRREST